MRRLALAGAVLALPLILAAPASATETPAPIASEPPGGATCAPGLPSNGCGQDTGATPAPTKNTSSGSGTKTTGSGTRTVTTLPSTGSLPQTGPQDAARTGAIGLTLLGAGAVLVAATRRRTA